jgi:hypothetical protein
MNTDVASEYEIEKKNVKTLTVTISSISCREMYPFPSRSYMEKAHFSFCSSLPREVTDRAQRNSRKSMVPSPLASKVRNTCSANFNVINVIVKKKIS